MIRIVVAALLSGLVCCGQAIAATAPAPQVLAEAVSKYEALRTSAPSQGSVAENRFLLIDYGLPVNTQRLFFIEKTNGQWSVTASLYVAHGSGSAAQGQLIPTVFSDKPGGNASTLGAFRVSDQARQSQCPTVGRCIHIDGLEPQNKNAYDRAVVIHSNEKRQGLITKVKGGKYFVPEAGLFGRSNGCPVVADKDLDAVIAFATPGTLLYIGRSPR